MFGHKTMLEGRKEVVESKWVMMFDTKICSIYLEATQVNEIGL